MAFAAANGAIVRRDSAYAASAAGRAAPTAQIIRSVYNTPTEYNQGYDFGFETDNGIQQSSVGEMRRVGDEEVIVMRGSYQYTDANGDLVEVSWTADENGYRAESAILPVAPAIPFAAQAEAVARQIEFAQQQRAAASSQSASVVPAPAYAAYNY